MSKKTFKDALLDAWDALIPLVGLNLIWLVLTLLIVPAIPAFGALYYATNSIAHGKSASFSTFFEGFKKQFWISWKWGLLTLLIFGLLFLNIWFYGQFDGIGYLFLQSLFLSLTLIFTSMLIYTYPLLLEQEEPSIKMAFRNSFVLFVRFMGRSLITMLSFLALSVVSVLLPPLWVILTMSTIIYFSNWQTLSVIYKVKNAAPKPEEEPNA